MTTATRFLMVDLDAACVRLQLANDGRLGFHPKAFPGELVSRIREHKAELVELLTIANLHSLPLGVDPVFVHPPNGSTPEQWRDRLMQRAESCREHHPDCSWEYQLTARAVERVYGVPNRENQVSKIS